MDKFTKIAQTKEITDKFNQVKHYVNNILKKLHEDGDIEFYYQLRKKADFIWEQDYRGMYPPYERMIQETLNLIGEFKNSNNPFDDRLEFKAMKKKVSELLEQFKQSGNIQAYNQLRKAASFIWEQNYWGKNPPYKEISLKITELLEQFGSDNLVKTAQSNDIPIKDLIFQSVHTIGNTTFALETNWDTMKNRLNKNGFMNENIQEVVTAIDKNISILVDRVVAIKELDT